MFIKHCTLFLLFHTRNPEIFNFVDESHKSLKFRVNVKSLLYLYSVDKTTSDGTADYTEGGSNKTESKPTEKLVCTQRK